VELTVQNKRLAEELKNAPSPVYVEQLEKKDKQTTERLKELRKELQQAKNKIDELEKLSQELKNELQQEKDKVLELEKHSHVEERVVDANPQLTLPPTTDYDLIPGLLDTDTHNMLGYQSPKHDSLSNESTTIAYGLCFNSIFSSTKLARSQTTPEAPPPPEEYALDNVLAAFQSFKG
jgi:TolA-binding protein